MFQCPGTHPPCVSPHRMKVPGGKPASAELSAEVLPFRPALDRSTRVADEVDHSVAALLRDLRQSNHVAGAVEQVWRANGLLRSLLWPPPYDQTRHVLHLGDACSLSWIQDESVHLVVTSLG
jgi:hypothetical protein